MAHETILIFRIGSLGDTIVALPCFHLIARAFPDAHRVLVTDTPTSHKTAPVESILGSSGLVHDVIYFPPPPRRLRDLFALRSRIRVTRTKTLIYVADREPRDTVRDRIFFRLSGIRNIIGAKVAARVRKLRINPATGEAEHEAERLARCLEPLGSVDLHAPTSWDLLLQAEEIRFAEAALAPLHGRDFIAVNMSSKIAQKDWGDDNWTALLRMLAPKMSKLGLVFIGAGDEAARATALAANWLAPTLNLCGRLAPRESAAAMRGAHLFIGHDGGPLHLAAAVGIACVGIYGNYNMPKWWHPMGRRHRIVHNMSGVQVIRPEDVCDAVMIVSENETAALGARGTAVSV